MPPNLCLDGGCCLCGAPGCVSGIVGWPPGFGYFVDLFKNRVGNYVRRLVGRRKPKKVIICICMISPSFMLRVVHWIQWQGEVV